MPATGTDTCDGPISSRLAAEDADGSRAHRIALANRLRRVEGQVRGIARMVEEEAYCIDTLTQVSAASHALQSVALLLLERHLHHCLAEAAASEDGIQEPKVREAVDAIARLTRF
jgi:CsoR family transcriptional regulator, copper-sensing transcriptional repressor